MKFIPFKIHSGSQNMQIDSDLLDKYILSAEQEPTFRLYGWQPRCVSLGRNQSDDFLNYDFLKKENIDVVRRITGGRALLHDMEITYSFICPVSFLNCGDSVTKSYIEISKLLIRFFNKFGIELDIVAEKSVKTKYDYCMMISTGADLCYKGKKLIGSAQCRKNGYILQHGSILYDYNLELLQKIFREKPELSQFTYLKKINPEVFFVLQSLCEIDGILQ